MERCILLVDNSNLFIGGQKHSARLQARENGSEPDGDACDRAWRLDYGALREFMAGGRDVLAALMVGSSPGGEEDRFWDIARESGFEVVAYERSPYRGEKRVDTELVARGTELIVEAEQPMILVIGSADSDYVPLVEVAHRHDWQVELCAFSDDFDPCGELASAVDRVRLLDEAFPGLGFRDS